MARMTWMAAGVYEKPAAIRVIRAIRGYKSRLKYAHETAIDLVFNPHSDSYLLRIRTNNGDRSVPNHTFANRSGDRPALERMGCECYQHALPTTGPGAPQRCRGS